MFAMYVYWNAALGVTCNEIDLGHMYRDEDGMLLVWPEDMGWKRIRVYLTDKARDDWNAGEWDSAMWLADCAYM